MDRSPPVLMAKLTFRNTDQAGTVINLKEGVTRVGRNPANEIIINDASVSSFHCELSAAEIGVGVKDLGSTNGTFVNLKPVAKAMLQNGDVLTLGSVDFSVELPQVNVAIPEISKPEALGAAFLEDGTPGCFVHRTSEATQQCTKCENWYCDACVRVLKKVSGQALSFCPECSAPCMALPRQAATAKKGFLSRLQETLLLKRK